MVRSHSTLLDQITSSTKAAVAVASATTASGVVDQLGDDILVLDGGLTKIQLSSTVLDLTTDPPLFLRKGSVTLS